MTIESLAALGAHDEVAPAWHEAVTPGITATPFSLRVTEGLQEVNRQLITSQRDLQQLAAGEVESLHEVLIRLEESRTGLQLLLQVRNRVLEAYQDVMRMQV